MSIPVIAPLLNPNEPEAILAALHVSEGQRVHCGEPLFTLETTKSTAEVVAEADGYVVNLEAASGQLLQAGDVIFYIAETPDWRPPQVETTSSEVGLETRTNLAEIPTGLRISQPALTLASVSGLDLAVLPRDVFVTEKCRAYTPARGCATRCRLLNTASRRRSENTGPMPRSAIMRTSGHSP